MGHRKRLACLLRAGLCAWAATGLPALAGQAEAEEAAVDVGRNLPFLGGFLRETQVLYPVEVDGWRVLGEHLYENPRDGASVRYGREDSAAWIDVFVYPAGVLDGEAFARAAGAERDSLRQARLQSGDQAPELSALLPFASTRDPEGGIPSAYSLDGSIHVRGQTYDTAMTIALDRMHFVKGRMSRASGEGTREQLRGELEAFMRVLAPRLQIRGSGLCWDAPLGDGRHGRDVPGCVGPDAPDLEPGPGMRRIRIEYPPPAPPRALPRGTPEMG
jgi:hypothetical protein